MVLIHGGGLGNGPNHVEPGGAVRNFISRGVVLVSIQYRLAFLGK